MMYDVAVVGAGLVGANAALSLAQLGYRVAVIDADPPARSQATPELRVLALSYQTVQGFQKLGIDIRELQDRACTYESLFIDDDQHETQMTLHANLVNRPYLGKIVENRTLLSLLHTALHSQTDCFFEEKSLELKNIPKGFVIETDNRSIQARVILGADGAHSWVRRSLGITQQEHDYAQRAWVAYVRSERRHEHCAWQRFLSTGSLALLPCADPHVTSMVWTLPSQVTADQPLYEMSVWESKLQAALGERLGKLSITSPVQSFPLYARHAHGYGTPGVFLLGDAAHTIHPLAGLGANLGCSDASALVRILAETPQLYWADPRVLARYERSRVHANGMVSRLMSALNTGMTKPNGIGKLRGWGMRLFDRMTPLKALTILYTDVI